MIRNAFSLSHMLQYLEIGRGEYSFCGSRSHHYSMISLQQASTDNSFIQLNAFRRVGVPPAARSVVFSCYHKVGQKQKIHRRLLLHLDEMGILRDMVPCPSATPANVLHQQWISSKTCSLNSFASDELVF